MLINSAYAAPASGGVQDQGAFSLLVMLAIFFVFIYFGMWRPQSKRAKEQKTLLGSLKKGDEVMTTGGILGKITDLSDQYLTVTIANNTDVKIKKSSIASVLPKGTIKAL